MKTPAVLCNILTVVLITAVTATEGLPQAAIDRVFTVLLIVVPLATIFVLPRRAPAGDWIQRGAGIANLAVAGLICWACIARYPYPEGNEVLIFAALILAGPLLSAWTLLRRPPEHPATN